MWCNGEHEFWDDDIGSPVQCWTTAPPSCHPLLGEVCLCWGIFGRATSYHSQFVIPWCCDTFILAMSKLFNIQTWRHFSRFWHQKLDLSWLLYFDSPLIYLVKFCPTLIISTHCDFWHEKFWWTSKVSIELILSRPLVSPKPSPWKPNLAWNWMKERKLRHKEGL